VLLGTLVRWGSLPAYPHSWSRSQPGRDRPGTAGAPTRLPVSCASWRLPRAAVLDVRAGERRGAGDHGTTPQRLACRVRRRRRVAAADVHCLRTNRSRLPGSSGSFGGSGLVKRIGLVIERDHSLPVSGQRRAPTLVRERGRTTPRRRTAAQAGLAALVAALLLAFHFRRVPQLVEEPASPGVGERMYRTTSTRVLRRRADRGGRAVSAVYVGLPRPRPGVFARRAPRAEVRVASCCRCDPRRPGCDRVRDALAAGGAVPPVAPRAGPAPEAEPIA